MPRETAQSEISELSDREIAILALHEARGARISSERLEERFDVITRKITRKIEDAERGVLEAIAHASDAKREATRTSATNEHLADAVATTARTRDRVVHMIGRALLPLVLAAGAGGVVYKTAGCSPHPLEISP